MNLGIVMQWSEFVDQEVLSLTERSSRSSRARRLCLHFRLQQVGWARWPSAGIYALKTAHLTRLQQALVPQVFQMGVGRHGNSSRAHHLLIFWFPPQHELSRRERQWKDSCKWCPPLHPVVRWTASGCCGGGTITTGALLCARGNSSLAYEVCNNSLLSVFIWSRTCLRWTRLYPLRLKWLRFHLLIYCGCRCNLVFLGGPSNVYHGLFGRICSCIHQTAGPWNLRLGNGNRLFLETR